MIVWWWNRNFDCLSGLQVRPGHTDPIELFVYALRSSGHAIVGNGTRRNLFDDARFSERRP